MSQESEKFEQLRGLLKLKRYEQPPPRYFENFSTLVIARIRLGERGDRSAPIWEPVLREVSWLQRLWAAFAAKPVVVGAFDLAVCALLITGVVYSERSNAHPRSFMPEPESRGFSSEEIAAAMAANHPLRAQRVAFEPSSTDPVPAVPLGYHW